jgi:outer membrane beta-barrel protein
MVNRSFAIFLLAAIHLGSATAYADDTENAEPKLEETAPAITEPLASGESKPGICIDEVIANRLAQKRKRRGAIDRLFIKQARHELTASGGYYNSDLFSGTYVVGGAYTFHMTEQTAVEFAGAYTHANADIIRALEDKRGQLLEDTYERVIFAEAALVWSPVYGKLRFGVDLLLGVGVVDSQASRGAAGVLGAGWKLFAGNAWAFRLDLRNRTFYQDLLSQRQLVNDTSVTAGVSLFLPFSP